MTQILLTFVVVIFTTTLASAASVLNIEIAPAYGGSESKISWYYTGDILTSGEAPDSIGGGVALPRILSTNIFSGNLWAFLNESPNMNGLILINGNSYNNYYSFNANGAGHYETTVYTNTATLSPITFSYDGVWLGGLSFNSSYGYLTNNYGKELNGLSTGPPNPDGTVSLVSPPTISNELVKYVPGVDSFTLPIDFSSFNYGIYTSGNQVGSIILTVVPEPTTYALFGIGAAGMLIALRRKKTA